MRKVELRQAAELPFWAKALAIELRDSRGFIVERNDAWQPTHTELTGWHLASHTTMGGEAWAYDVWLVQPRDKPKEMLIIEFARPSQKGDEELAAIQTAIDSVHM